MISCSADQSGHILTISYGRRVGPMETNAALETLRGLMPRMKAGFILLSDLTSLESMDADCAADIGAMAELLNLNRVACVIRVIPDPKKDIGFNIISLFHFRQPVKIHTRDNLAEAIKLLLQIEAPVSEVS
jgi:hypothetical protein